MTRREILGTLLPGFEGTTLPQWLRTLLGEGLAGVCLFGENVESRDQLRRLTDDIRSANPVALIAIDEEGGDVTRLHAATGSPFVGNALLGRIDDVELTRSVGERVGAELRAAGVNLDFAPDVDINSNSDNPVIGVRSFGAAAGPVSRHGAAWTRGLQSQGVAASIKHFPGHGDTGQDSHLALPVIDMALSELRARELEPFRAAIAAGAATVMTSHILLPRIDAQNAATFSSAILGGILRRELAFTGVVVTDALDMAGASAETGIPIAASRALQAGCDLLCIGTKNTAAQLEEIVAGVADALDRGGLGRDRLSDAARRVRELATSYTVQDAPVRLPGAPGAPDALADAFDVSDSAQRFLADETNALVIRLETEANTAVGDSPWGPFGLRSTVEALKIGAAAAAGARFFDTDRPLVVIGRDNHRRPWTVELIDELRARHPSVLVIDMGWPGDDRGYADIATYGASRIVSDALAALLERATAASLNGETR